MSTYDAIRTTVFIIVSLFVLIKFINTFFVKNKRVTTKFISRTAVFAAISIILYLVPFLKFRLPFFPSFLEVHLDEVPLLIAGFAYGPWSALFALTIKTLVKLPLSTTMCVGELADFIYSFFLIVPAAIIYKKHRNFKGVGVGLTLGVICQLLASCFITTFLILDFYMFMMHFEKAAIMKSIANAGINISSLDWPFFFSVALPFNLLKDIIVVIFTLLLYKRLRKIVENATSK